MNYKYKISVIIPIYNVEEYLGETIESVINQTMDFEENIQLILVNDGSPDNSEKICLKYKSQYPDNIIYIKKENGGVSSARNEGMKYIQGKYVNFLDGDDLWEKNAFQIVYEFFEHNYADIDVVAGRMCYFGAQQGYKHVLDYKFKKSRVVDLNQKYSFCQLSSATVFLKAEKLRGYLFDTRLKYGEDAHLMTLIIMDKMAYGVLRECIYYYRKRENGTSAMDNTICSASWYFDTPTFCHKSLIFQAKQKFGYIPQYVQFLIMYDLQWRLRCRITDSLSDDDKKIYIQLIVELLTCIDDKIILEQKNINFAYKLYALSLKYQTNIINKSIQNKWKMYLNDNVILDMHAIDRLCITGMEIRDDILYLSGTTQIGILGEEYSIGINTNLEEKYLKLYPIKQKDIYAFDGTKIFEGRGFCTEIPLKSVQWIEFELKKDGNTVTWLKPFFGKYAKLNHNTPFSYYWHENFVLKYRKNKIVVREFSLKYLLCSEARFLKHEIIKKHRYKAACYRLATILIKLLAKRETWIVSDRTDMARDNGEAFFRFLSEQKIHHNVFFAIDKNSADFMRMKQYGNVLKVGTVKYKLKFLTSAKIISAHADEWVMNAFPGHSGYMKDLYDFDFVFLQHGIIKDDLSVWLHKSKKNIRMFVTSAKDEYQSVLDGDYGYTEREVKLTGLPRYDRLVDHANKKIVIIPTWRKAIAQPTKKGTSVREYSDTFKATEYFKFYNRLINDERILISLKNSGYTGQFYLHPAFSAQAHDFHGNETIEVVDEPADYQKVFAENALLITDFSSVAFDFAYLKKPVVYTQFDIETIFQEQVYSKGYFDYKDDGFGPVCYTYEQAVKCIIQYINNNCKMENEYKNRVDRFYGFKDKNNCERVYQEIVNL